MINRLFRPHGSLDDLRCSVAHCLDNDEQLATLIEADSRKRLSEGRDVRVDDYVRAIPGLTSKPLALDAVIEFAIKSAIRTGRTEEEAAIDILREHPELREGVLRAVTLGALVGSTTQASLSLQLAPLTLPAQVGPLLPDGLARYELRELAGQGSQGEVYLALDRRFADPGRPAWVAVKRRAAATLQNNSIDEATKARRISHPNVAASLDRGICPDGSAYFVSEWVGPPGRVRDFETLCTTGHPRIRELVWMVQGVAQGVHAAHMVGLVHCDIKPTNVLLSADGVAKLVDFGIAAQHTMDACRSGGRGALGFASPEQLLGREDRGTIPVDVYGLGALLFFVLRGKPANGNSPQEVEQQLATEFSSRQSERTGRGRRDSNAALLQIALRALSFKPSDRHPSAMSFADDLQAWLDNRPIPWLKQSWPVKTRLLAKRQPLLLPSVLVTLGVIVAAAMAIGRQSMATEKRLADQRTAAANTLLEEKTKRLDAAVQHRKMVLNGLRAAQSLAKAGKSGELPSGWLPTVTLLDSLVGPALFEAYSAPEDLKLQEDWWEPCRKVAKARIAEFDARGLSSSLECQLWCETAAFWSIRAGDPDDALQLLDRTETYWSRLVTPNDPWLAIHSGIRTCARAAQLSRISDPSPQTLTDMTRTLQELDTMIQTLANDSMFKTLSALAVRERDRLRVQVAGGPGEQGLVSTRNE